MGTRFAWLQYTSTPARDSRSPSVDSSASLERERRFDSRRPARREPGGRQHDEDQDTDGQRHQQRVHSHLGRIRNQGPTGDRDSEACGRSGDGERGGLTKDHRLDTELGRADRHPQANLGGALADRIRHEAVETHDGEQHRRRRERGKERG